MVGWNAHLYMYNTDYIILLKIQTPINITFNVMIQSPFALTNAKVELMPSLMAHGRSDTLHPSNMTVNIGQVINGSISWRISYFHKLFQIVND